MIDDTKIIIDPTSRMLYASYYIEGLYSIYGRENVLFSSAPFTGLKRSSSDFSFEHYFAFIVQKPKKKELRVVIDFCDPPDIHTGAYRWCDRYAKINFNKKETQPEYLNKIIPIPPGFGIRIWNFWETFTICGKNYLKGRKRLKIGKKRLLRDYFAQFKRPRFKDYQLKDTTSTKSKKPYIFTIASLWKDETARGTTNQYRKKFMEAANKADCIFEGGFYIDKNRIKPKGYTDLLFTKPYTTSAYLKKTKASYLVFNTPAVHNCFGWKLAEYLAMGKAILSTPLTNDLSSPLKAGEQLHVIQANDDFDQTLE
ncbi:MAG: hypothetical protein WA951_01415, partial [Leeuwenhoekiella sp.]